MPYNQLILLTLLLLCAHSLCLLFEFLPRISPRHSQNEGISSRCSLWESTTGEYLTGQVLYILFTVGVDSIHCTPNNSNCKYSVKTDTLGDKDAHPPRGDLWFCISFASKTKPVKIVGSLASLVKATSAESDWIYQWNPTLEIDIKLPL
ncbi:hypothetical protein IW262DRAFT_1302342 [Armillaria fumosa]|nr:hypothetical protein IW262DRAFT_1302342 [Armillaria fumosa]